MDADAVIAGLGLAPHPEGGWYVETWRGEPTADGRACATAIYFLLRPGERSHWHRVDAAEVWLHHAGGPVRLSVARVDGLVEHLLGTWLAGGERPQAIVPPGAWQSAEPLDGWSLVSCVVAPGFEFDRFELAPNGWSPSAGAGG